MSNPAVRDAIEKLSPVITADPAKARARTAPATARLGAGLRCEVTGPRDERIATDMPPAMGGQGAAPNPGWYMRAATAACTTTAIAMRAARLGIALTTLEVTVETDSDHRGLLGLDDKVLAGFAAMRTKVKIAGNADAKALRELASWGEAHSPVGCTVKNAAACSIEVEVS